MIGSLNKSIYQTHISRFTLMIIDAMRADFAPPTSNTLMPYTNELIDKGLACRLNVTAVSPTVTMPRIKAITTGSIPNFIDVILNLGSPRLNIDSLLHQMHANNEKIVYAGDNTWAKMFPTLFERKYENIDSLYVNDFYEVNREDISIGTFVTFRFFCDSGR